MRYLLKEYKTSDDNSKEFLFMDNRYGNLVDITDKTTNVFITKYVGANKNVIIPSEFKGLPVKGVAEYAFENNKHIINVSLPESIKDIHYAAFTGCSNLQYLEMTNSVNFMGSYVFESCDNLKNVVLSNNITTIYEYTFKDCKNLLKINIPNKLKSIEYTAFSGCVNIPINLKNELLKYGGLKF